MTEREWKNVMLVVSLLQEENSGEMRSPFRFAVGPQ